MENLFEYVKNYGNKSFREMPFSDVDMVLLTQISMLNWKNIVPEKNSKLTIKEAYNVFVNKKENHTFNYFVSVDMFVLLKLMASSERFKNIKMSNAERIVNIENEEQFYGMTYDIGLLKRCIIFSGTDEKIASWKEDFNLLYQKQVPCEKDALAYLDRVMKNGLFNSYAIGGHSKGGHLALYSALHTSKQNQDKITDVVNFDGPGLNDEDSELLQNSKIIKKMRTYFPQNSIVGKLFNHPEKINIMKAKGLLVMQHMARAWQIKDGKLDLRNNYEPFSIAFDGRIKKITEEMSIEDRKILVDGFFDLLKVNGVEDVEDLLQNKAEIFKNVLKADEKFVEVGKKFLGDILKDKLIRETFVKHIFNGDKKSVNRLLKSMDIDIKNLEQEETQLTF